MGGSRARDDRTTAMNRNPGPDDRNRRGCAKCLRPRRARDRGRPGAAQATLALALTFALALAMAPPTVGGQPAAADSLTAVAPPTPEASPRRLLLAGVELVGATRTDLATVYRYLQLQPGQAIDQSGLVAAVEALRAGGLFRSVAFYTRPGTERGQLVLVLEVVEHRLDFRWAAGNTNLDGWYLVPAMVAADNAFGDGGNLDLRWRVGLRHDALALRYHRPRIGDGRDYWSAELDAGGTERPYFTDGVELRHRVDSAGLALTFGRHLNANQLLEFGGDARTVEVSDHAIAHTRSVDGTIDFDQEIPAADLPPAISETIGRHGRASAYLDWQYDSRATEVRAGTPIGGLWGRVKGQLVVQEDQAGHAALQMDLRTFKQMRGGVLASRVRAAWVGRNAPFHDRLYLGGMYSVRGFPTAALSAPAGDTWLWSGSLEYRSSILADARGTTLAGLLFVDAGAAGAADASDPYPDVAVGVGYGLRLRVRWLDWIGVDLGFPLTERPLDMRFQGHASIGWSF